MPFTGFPQNVRHTPTPDPLFNNLLAEIEDLGELKVTLRAVWLLAQKRGAFQSLTEAELCHDPTLRLALKSLGGNPRERISRALAQAVARQTLLRAEPANKSEPACYRLNTAANRRELARRRDGAAPQAGQNGRGLYPVVSDEAMEPPAGERPNIYTLYEDNIGSIGVVLAEELRDAEESYPWPWITAAFRIAIVENKRSWRYICAILRRWAAEGRHESGNAFDDRPTTHPGVGVKAGAVLWPEERRREEDGKPGRHTPTDNRRQFPEDYLRR